MAAAHFQVSNFRAIEQLSWAPSGVCVLSGANGAGKSTVLDVFRFLRAFFFHGSEEAMRVADGIAFKRWGASESDLVTFEVTIGEITWSLYIPASAMGVDLRYGETLLKVEPEVSESVLYNAQVFSKNRAEEMFGGCGAKVLWDQGKHREELTPLVSLLDSLRVYDTYALKEVKAVKPISTSDSILHGTGQNLWSVLANWKSAPMRYEDRFNWVMQHARRAFPELLGSIEFDRGLPYIYRPGASDPAEGLLPNRMADGLLTGLLHLTAVAGARPGGLVAFDEVENQLHPHAIRSLLASMRELADERDLTVILTTHSPVVLNGFRDEPEQVYVLNHGDPHLDNPASMAELHDEAWLAQAKLGSLYEQLAFGAPSLDGGRS